MCSLNVGIGYMCYEVAVGVLLLLRWWFSINGVTLIVNLLELFLLLLVSDDFFLALGVNPL